MAQTLACTKQPACVTSLQHNLHMAMPCAFVEPAVVS